MARYIDADILMKEFEVDTSKDAMDISDIVFGAVTSIIEKQPTADVVEVKHGEWIMEYYETRSTRGRLIRNKTFTCSNCNRRNGRITTNYCPNCGAKMDGGNAE